MSAVHDTPAPTQTSILYSGGTSKFATRGPVWAPTVVRIDPLQPTLGLPQNSNAFAVRVYARPASQG